MLAAANDAAGDPYAAPGAEADTHLSASAVSGAGRSEPHDNVQPFVTMSFGIALVGVFPSRS